ncbi:MAG: GNAT family N-acetyltransferase [Solirubrobacterales bacterium]
MAVVRLRPFEPSDVDAMIALFRDSVRVAARGDYDEAQLRAWAPDDIDREAWAARAAGRATLIAEVEGGMAGFADLLPTGHIDLFYVSAGHLRMGVATAMLAEIERMAASQGIRHLTVEASITARPFFEARKFRVLAAQVVERRGQRLTNFRMEKTLVP